MLPLMLAMLSVNVETVDSGVMPAVEWDGSVCLAIRNNLQAGTMRKICNWKDIRQSMFFLTIESILSEIHACKSFWADSPTLVKFYCTAVGMFAWNVDRHRGPYYGQPYFTFATCRERVSYHAERLISLCSLKCPISTAQMELVALFHGIGMWSVVTILN